ncbi:MAG: glycosyltransferase family 2 protein [Patescibacteria group bacterium]
MKIYPTISIVTTSYNSNLEIFESVLKSIKEQDYPRNKIEHLIADGGSTNGAIELAKKYNCKVIVKKEFQEEINARMHEGIKQSKNEIITIIETDNILPDISWLKRMTEPFIDHKDIFCTFNSRNCYSKDMSPLSRYCALFGVSDPVLYYLNKSDKLPWSKPETYDKGQKLECNNNYSIVSFDHDTLPTLGDNGCLYRRDAFNRSKISQTNFIHLDLFTELLSLGYQKFGVVHNCIYHVTGSSIFNMIKRRLYYRKVYFENKRNARKYLVFNPHSNTDKINLVKFCIFTATWVEPIIQSIKGFNKIPDPAWFLHPLICWIYLIGYAQFEVRKALSKLLS